MITQAQGAGVGATLKRAREARGISLKELAERTKISARAFEAIERDNVKPLPGGIFARSFVRTYAAEVGLDVEATVDAFFAQFVEAEPEPGPEPEQADAWDSLAVRAELLRVGAVVLPLAVLVVWLVWGWSRTDAPQPIAATPIPAVRTDVPQPTPTRPASDVVRAGGPLDRDDLSLRITARAACWVSATADGREAYRHLMAAGDEVTLDASRELQVHFGDAGAVSLELNGARVPSVGNDGQVVTLRIDHDNAHEYAVARPLMH